MEQNNQKSTVIYFDIPLPEKQAYDSDKAVSCIKIGKSSRDASMSLYAAAQNRGNHTGYSVPMYIVEALDLGFLKEGNKADDIFRELYFNDTFVTSRQKNSNLDLSDERIVKAGAEFIYDIKKSDVIKAVSDFRKVLNGIAYLDITSDKKYERLLKLFNMTSDEELSEKQIKSARKDIHALQDKIREKLKDLTADDLSNTIPFKVAKEMLSGYSFKRNDRVCIVAKNATEFEHFYDSNKSLNKANVECFCFTDEVKDKIYNNYGIICHTYSEDLSDMKFDYVIQNPPYKGSLHLSFFRQGLDMLKSTGKMIIIEPSTWFTNRFKYNSAYRINEDVNDILKRIERHVESVHVENYRREFGIHVKNTLAIIKIDFSKNYDLIKYNQMGTISDEKSILDCNFIGKFDQVCNILEPIRTSNKFDHMIDHCIDKKHPENYENKGYHFWRIATYQLNTVGSNGTFNRFLNKPYNVHKFGSYFNSYLDIAGFQCEFTSKGEKKAYTKTYNTIPLGARNNSLCDAVYAKSAEEIDNFEYFVYNNKLSLFINICLTFDEHNNVMEYLPWPDRKYTDEELYEIYNIDEEQQKIIDDTLVKFEKNSPWFKRYISGIKDYNN